MNIIIPMAGRGTRLRPHTLTTPKPLIPVAGRPIVDWLAEDLISLCPEKVKNIAFIIGDFGKEVEDDLLEIAAGHGAQGHIFYQEEALGTAHAILCAKSMLSGKVLIAFADTLFRTEYVIDTDKDAVIFVQKVEDPRAFGVVKIGGDGRITDFVEKPAEFVSDLAIIGIYYFKDGEYLRGQLQYLIDNNIQDKGEFQLTSGMENMKNSGTSFYPGAVDEWLDCGNKNATVYTNQRLLDFKKKAASKGKNVEAVDSTIIPPCYIGDDVVISGSVIGPYVSIGSGAQVLNSVISGSIIQDHSVIRNTVLSNSMIGKHVTLNGHAEEYSIGDYTQVNSIK